jgi:hypothetical protein
MHKTIVILSALLAGAGASSAAGAACPWPDDVQALFFPSAAWQTEEGRNWQAAVHVWIFEPEADSRLRQAGLAALRISLGLPKEAAETATFKERAAHFLVDNERGKTLTLEIDNHVFPLGPSAASGHIDQVVSIPREWVHADAAGTISFAAVPCPGDARRYTGVIHLVPQEGISVISDIDDTIKISSVSVRRELLANTFLRPYDAVPGMPELYRGWQKEGVVFHYVSAAPWPLYPVIARFLKDGGFPGGAMTLKHFRLKSKGVFSLFGAQDRFKKKAIEDILRHYPRREFLLIGDSGEQDPEIYGDLARQFGTQIRLIAIRELDSRETSPGRCRKAFRGLPDYQWQVFRSPIEIRDAPTRKVEGLEAEWAAVLRYRDGLRSVLSFAKTRPELFPAAPLKKSRMLTRAQKETLWSSWKTFLDYVLALDTLERSHRALPRPGIRADRESFLVRYGATLAKYRWSLEWIDRLDRDPGFRVVLNEPVPELGLPKGTLDRVKFRFLNVGAATEFGALAMVYKNVGGREAPALRQAIGEDSSAIWRIGRWEGQVLTLENAFQILKNAGFKAWFPVQAGVSEWMGDTKVYRRNRSLITSEQIASLHERLEPGDILLERREWYLSNIGLPGFWPHAALYIGTPEERREFFEGVSLSSSPAAAGGGSIEPFEHLLQARYPKAYQDSLADYHGNPPRVLEAISEGVSFTSLEHSADADSLVVLRARLPKQEKAEAIRRAFHYAGRPYDFNFDFTTDSSLVCSELIYKAYEPGPSMKGLRFDWVEMLGRPVTPPNLMARQFDRELGKPEQQMDFVLFLDGNDRTGKAVSSGVEAFRKSWMRPKWHTLVE